MHSSRALLSLTAISLLGCNKIKVEEIPCLHRPEKICGEQVKRLVNKEWKLDGWKIDRFGSEGEQFAAYRDGEFKYSEGNPSHAKWFTRAHAKEFELTVVEMDTAENKILIKSGDKRVLYQLNFVENELKFVFKIPQGFNEKIDTLFNKNAPKQ